MASRRAKKAKVVEEPRIEDKENATSRRAGRATKPVNYVENVDSPVVSKKKGSAKAKSSKTDEEIIENGKTKTQKGKQTKRKIMEVEEHTEEERRTTTKSAKSKAVPKGRNKKTKEDTQSLKDEVVEEHEHENVLRNDKSETTENEQEDVSRSRKDRKGTTKNKGRGKQNNKMEPVIDEDDQNVTNEVTNSKPSKTAGKQTKGKTRQPLESRNDNTQNVQNQHSTPRSKNSTKPGSLEQTPKLPDEEPCEDDKTHENSNIQRENEKGKEDKIAEQSEQKTGNSTFTLENVQETPVTTNTRRTPGRSRSIQQNTPSSESRVSLVLSNIRKDSLSANTPNIGHADCASKMSQVYEILELVTDQLTDLKAEMETVKTANETIQKELDSSKEEARQLKEEMKNLKNETIHQKSPSKQNEIEILWKQCDAQKKTIRSLHDQLDNTKTEFDQRFDKYKKAMVFILCKTRPDIQHSDVAKLRNLLNKTEKCLELTIDEICSSMESDIPYSKPVNNIPAIAVTDNSKSKTGTSDKNDNKVFRDDKTRDSVRKHDTPLKDDQNIDPFQCRNRLQVTPNSRQQTNSSPASRNSNRLRTTPNRQQQNGNSTPTRNSNHLQTTPTIEYDNPFQTKHKLKRTPQPLQ